MKDSSKPAGRQKKKIFVLDTSVILYDALAIRNFQEHDVAIPIHVLEELDNFKRGNDIKNFEAREFIRFVDELSRTRLINDWVPINGHSKGRFRVILDSIPSQTNAVEVFGSDKNDHKILNTALVLHEQFPGKKVILVSKDICLRLKAKALNIPAEDYETGKVKDIKTLYTGITQLDDVDARLIDRLYSDGVIHPAYLQLPDSVNNHYYILRNRKKSILAFLNAVTGMIEPVKINKIYGITARNAEQTFAIHALTNPDIKLVTLQGIAGTGKTLLAIASALEQRKHYRQIYVTSPVIPLSNKDIGYLPGDIKAKLNPYLEPIWDNLKYIKSLFDPKDAHAKRIDEMVETEKIAIAPLAYIRGRSLSKIFFIADEAQNLTPHEIKTIISRAADNTKIVFTGDIYQIDTPYLDARSNGLSYLIDRVKGHPLFAHVTLSKGERSDLANLANELL